MGVCGASTQAKANISLVALHPGETDLRGTNASLCPWVERSGTCAVQQLRRLAQQGAGPTAHGGGEPHKHP